MSRQRLTKRLVEATIPEAHDLYLWDSEVVGFGLKVTPAGAKSFVLQYRFEGRSRRFAIGRVGSPWSVETARDRARVLLGELAGGEDPQARKAEARRSFTVAGLCELFLAEGMVTRKAASIASAESSYRNHVKPLLGARRLSLLCRADIERLLAEVAAGATRRSYKGAKPHAGRVKVAGGKGAATSAVVMLSGALSFGVRRGLCDANPALGVRKFPSRKLERYLTPAELARLGEVLDAATALGVEDPYRIAAIRLLLLTGCRKGEVLTLKRAFVDRHHRCLRLPDSKTGQKSVHVGQAVLDLIATLPEIPGNPYLLPGRGGAGHVGDIQSTWETIRKAAGLEDVRLHDLRHSYASVGAVGGDSLMVIGALLGHRTAQSTERYAHLGDDPVRRAAERISGEIARLMECAGSDAATSPEPVSEEEALAEAPELAGLVGRLVRTTWLDCASAASRSGYTTGTLATYRSMGVGPPFRRVGRRIVYDARELDAWSATARSGWSPGELKAEAEPA
jgi:site-specific recombinase XerD